MEKGVPVPAGQEPFLYNEAEQFELGWLPNRPPLDFGAAAEAVLRHPDMPWQPGTTRLDILKAIATIDPEDRTLVAGVITEYASGGAAVLNPDDVVDALSYVYRACTGTYRAKEDRPKREEPEMPDVLRGASKDPERRQPVQPPRPKRPTPPWAQPHAPRAQVTHRPGYGLAPEDYARKLRRQAFMRKRFAAYVARGAEVLGLRRGQDRTLEQTNEYWQNADPETLRHPVLWDTSPSSGKTVMAIKTAEGCAVGEVPPGDTEPIHGATGVDSLQQVQQTGFTEDKGYPQFAPHIGVSEYTGRRKQPWSDMGITTSRALLSMPSSDFWDLARRTDLLILDEVHEMIGPKMRDAAILPLMDYALTVVMTATPDYSEIHNVSSRLNIQKIVKGPTIPEAMYGGMANGGQFFTLSCDTLIDVKSRRGDLTEFDMAGLIGDRNFNRTILEMMRFFATRPDPYRGLTICVPSGGAPQAHARWVAEACSRIRIVDPRTGQERFMNVESLGSYKTSKENLYSLDKYRAGDLDALTTVDWGTTGLDIDDIEYVLFTPPTTSDVKMLQAIGRGMRHKRRPTIYVQIIGRYKNLRRRLALLTDIFEREHIEQGMIVGQPALWSPPPPRPRSGPVTRTFAPVGPIVSGAGLPVSPQPAKFGEAAPRIFLPPPRTEQPAGGSPVRPPDRPAKPGSTPVEVVYADPVTLGGIALESFPDLPRHSAEAISGALIQELTAVSLKYARPPEGWVLYDDLDLRFKEEFSQPTILAIMAEHGIEPHKWKNRLYFPPDYQELLRDYKPMQTADQLWVSRKRVSELLGTDLSSELFDKIVAELDIPQKEMRINYGTKRPGHHIPASKVPLMKLYLATEYPPIDPERDELLKDIGQHVGRHPSQVSKLVRREFGEAVIRKRYTEEKRREAYCVDSWVSDALAEHYGKVHFRDRQDARKQAPFVPQNNAGRALSVMHRRDNYERIFSPDESRALQAHLTEYRPSTRPSMQITVSALGSLATLAAAVPESRMLPVEAEALEFLSTMTAVAPGEDPGPGSFNALKLLIHEATGHNEEDIANRMNVSVLRSLATIHRCVSRPGDV